MRLRLTPAAISDVKRIYRESIKRFGIKQADRYQDGLAEILQVIAEHPRLNREHAQFRRPMRLHPYESHVVAYIIDEDSVAVVRILHAHQNLRRIL